MIGVSLRGSALRFSSYGTRDSMNLRIITTGISGYQTTGNQCFHIGGWPPFAILFDMRGLNVSYDVSGHYPSIIEGRDQIGFGTN